MYEFNHLSVFSYPLESGPHAWVQGLLMMALDAHVRDGEAAAMRYRDAVSTAKAVYGADAPCYLVDPALYGELSDSTKEHYGFRYRGDCSCAEALEELAQIARWIDSNIREDELHAEIAAQRSFGAERQPSVMELAFASALKA